MCHKDEAHPILNLRISADLTGGELVVKNVLHNFKEKKKRKKRVQPRPGRFQVSLFLPAATASYMTQSIWDKERLQERKKIHRWRNATMNNPKQTNWPGVSDKYFVDIPPRTRHREQGVVPEHYMCFKCRTLWKSCFQYMNAHWS